MHVNPDRANSVLTDLCSSLATLADRPVVSHCSSGSPVGIVPSRRHQPGLAGCCHHCHRAHGPVTPASAEWAVWEWTPRDSHTRTWWSARRSTEWGSWTEHCTELHAESDNSKEELSKREAYGKNNVCSLQLSMLWIASSIYKVLKSCAFELSLSIQVLQNHSKKSFVKF